MSDERCVVLAQSPPKRLSPGARFRSLKRQADMDVWSRLGTQVDALVAEGYRPRRIHVSFGTSRPLGAGVLLSWVALAVGCRVDECTLTEEWTGQGRGTTEVCLERPEAV